MSKRPTITRRTTLQGAGAIGLGSVLPSPGAPGASATDLSSRAKALLVSAPTAEQALVARRLLEEALQLEPQSAESWSCLAWELVNDYLCNWNEARQGPEAAKELLRRAEKAWQEALKIDPTVARAHQADGYIRRAKGDHQGALDAFERTIQLDPNYAAAYAQKANQLVMLGRPKEAPPLALKAMSLNPNNSYMGAFYWALGRAYFE